MSPLPFFKNGQGHEYGRTKSIQYSTFIKLTSIGALSKRTNKWSGQQSAGRTIIPYYLSNSYNDNQKATIRTAVAQLSSWIDCIEITEISEADSSRYSNKIHVYPGGGCWSYLGMIRSSKQDLSLASNCLKTGIIQHEFIHALGKYNQVKAFFILDGSISIF